MFLGYWSKAKYPEESPTQKARLKPTSLQLWGEGSSHWAPTTHQSKTQFLAVDFYKTCTFYKCFTERTQGQRIPVCFSNLCQWCDFKYFTGIHRSEVNACLFLDMECQQMWGCCWELTWPFGEWQLRSSSSSECLGGSQCWREAEGEGRGPWRNRADLQPPSAPVCPCCLSLHASASCMSPGSYHSMLSTKLDNIPQLISFLLYAARWIQCHSIPECEQPLRR